MRRTSIIPACEEIRFSRLRRFAVRVLVAPCLVSCAATVASALTADSADDICAPSADPCEVTDMVKVVAGSELDFGQRTVSLTGNGGFNFGAGSGSILCGSFEASTATAIDASGFEDGALASGAVSIYARRACASDLDRPCMEDVNCDFGDCSARRCSDGPTTICTDDASCQFGACLPFRRCEGNFALRCSTNSDCDLGSCPDQLTCSEASPPVECSSNTDCYLGTCSVGDGSISMDGAIQGSSTAPATIKLIAAGPVSISKPVNLTSKSREWDGGELEVESVTGSVTISDRIRARGGSLSRGGEITLTAAEDVVVEAKVNLNGGDFDGGNLDIAADRDIRIEDSVLASSRNGAGYGGILTLSAGRDISIGAAGLHSRVAIIANGHRDRFRFPGDGGIVEMYAAGNIVVPSHVSVSLDGSRSGYGGELYLAADGDIAFDGFASVSASGDESAGGFVELDALGVLTMADTASFEVVGGGLGGDLLFRADRGIDYAGDILLTGAADDSGGDLDLYSFGDVTFSGQISVFGRRPDVYVRGCHVTMTGTAAIRNALDGITTVESHESTRLLAGSVIETPEGENRFRYRTDEKPPFVDGTVTPAATLQVLGGAGCSVCGNNEIDQLETCDDGNVVSGDGCDNACLIE